MDLVASGQRRKRSHEKVRTGCLACKRRRVKCDEKQPTCGTCTRRSDVCEYVVPQVWLFEPERLKEKEKLDHASSSLTVKPPLLPPHWRMTKDRLDFLFYLEKSVPLLGYSLQSDERSSHINAEDASFLLVSQMLSSSPDSSSSQHRSSVVVAGLPVLAEMDGLAQFWGRFIPQVAHREPLIWKLTSLLASCQRAATYMDQSRSSRLARMHQYASILSSLTGPKARADPDLLMISAMLLFAYENIQASSVAIESDEPESPPAITLDGGWSVHPGETAPTDAATPRFRGPNIVHLSAIFQLMAQCDGVLRRREPWLDEYVSPVRNNFFQMVSFFSPSADESHPERGSDHDDTTVSSSSFSPCSSSNSHVDSASLGPAPTAPKRDMALPELPSVFENRQSAIGHFAQICQHHRRQLRRAKASKTPSSSVQAHAAAVAAESLLMATTGRLLNEWNVLVQTHYLHVRAKLDYRETRATFALLTEYQLVRAAFEMPMMPQVPTSRQPALQQQQQQQQRKQR